MSKKDRKRQQQMQSKEAVEPQAQQAPPVARFVSFDHFWAIYVKNGNELIKQSAIAHLKAIDS